MLSATMSFFSAITSLLNIAGLEDKKALRFDSIFEAVKECNLLWGEG